MKGVTEKVKKWSQSKVSNNINNNDIFTGRVRPEWIPENWIAKPSRSGNGIKYLNPDNPNDNIRIMPGNPNSRFPSQRKPYVKRQKNGALVDSNGNRVLDTRENPSNESIESHIPYEEYIKNKNNIER